MKVPRAPHRWSVSPKEAAAIQMRFAPLVRQVELKRTVRFVAGTDMAFSCDGKQCIAGVVLWDMHEETIVEQHVATRDLTFPYVPGLLSFREAPAVIAALRKLKCIPDALICDGQGLAHPRRFGLACHVGVIVNLPTIGCAKSRLMGTHRTLPLRRSSRTALTSQGERIGTVLRTRNGIKPVYVSVGHLIDLPAAERIVLNCAVKYRLPEPTRLADRLVAKRKMQS